MHDKCTICVEHTICSEIVLDGPDGTPRWRVSFGISLPSVWRQALLSVQDRCMVCAGRNIGLEIILDAPDGTPTSCGLSESLVQSVWR